MENAENELSHDEINEMEERRIAKLQEAGIDEMAVIQNARENINRWNGYFNENITRGKSDANFLLRDQWNDIERSEFIRLFKPAMTFNKLYDATKKIIGEQRKNKPDLMVRSLTGKASQEQIDLRADLVRTIAYQSQNDLVYQIAFKNALTMGYGAFQICIDYETPTSFNQIIRYEAIPDPTYTAFDPTAIKPHKGDGNFCSRKYVLTKEEFYATYPYINNPVSFVDPRTLLDFEFQTSDTIILCDHYQKEWYPVILYKLSNGMTVTQDEWEDMQKSFKLKKELAKDALVVGDIIRDEIPKIVRERQSQAYKIRHYRLLQNQIVDFSDWPSKFLPIIFVDGDSYFYEGRQITRSFIRDAIDSQRFLNYNNSEIAAEIKNRRREQWIGTPDNIIGYEQMWRNPELQNGILIAKPDPKTGMMPQKMQPWDLSPALMQNSLRATQDIKEILGFSEAEQLQGRDISGKARQERKLEGSMSSYVYSDNLNQSMEQGGRVNLDLLPFVYSEDERHMIISKQGGGTKSIILNKRNEDGTIENELSSGDYDVEIDTGPSFAVQKEIALEFLQQTIAMDPQKMLPLSADIWAKNLDVQFMPQLAERYKTLVPPQILAKEEGLPPPPPQPNPQEQMMQLEMQNQTQQLMDRAHELEIRQQKHELEKVQLALKVREMQDKLGMNREAKAVELHKSNLDFQAELAKIAADLHMSRESNRHKNAM